jgi:hypothetical protein
MRDIKIRMWNPAGNAGDGKYHYGDEAMECLMQQNSGLYDHVKEYGAAFEQFTGLHDKNGVEIYEGDRVIMRNVLSEFSFNKAKDVEGEIVYMSGGFVCYNPEGWCEPVGYKPSAVEVIGNIHQEVTK